MAQAAQSVSSANGIVPVRIKFLYLDNTNPRMARSQVFSASAQTEIIKELYIRYDLSDVLMSLSQHGYFSEEPLIGIPKGMPKKDGHREYVIVEGNRRLAALKLLLDRDIRTAVGAKNIPTVSDAIKAKLDPVPVKVYTTRNEIVPYLGVRHITGVRPWDSQSKAKYILGLVDEGYSIKVISKLVASRSDVVGRLLLTLYILKQANAFSDQPWDEEAKGFKFSFLYTALGYKTIRNALGLPDNALDAPRPNLVPRTRHNELLELLGFIYGSPSGREPSKIYESRDLKALASIYENKEALSLLKAGAPISQAYRRSGGELKVLHELLQDISWRLEEANGLAPYYKEDETTIKLVKRCQVAINSLVKILEG